MATLARDCQERTVRTSGMPHVPNFGHHPLRNLRFPSEVPAGRELTRPRLTHCDGYFMHTQALLDTPPLSHDPDQRASAETAAALPPQDRTARYIAFAALGIALLSLSVWYLAGAAVLAAMGVSLSLLLLGALFVANNRIRRSLAELARFVTRLGEIGDAAGTASFDLQGPWRALARGILESYESLLQQLRERQVALQKLEFSQSLVQAAQRRAEAIFASLTDAVVVTNEFGDLVLANAEAERILGFKLDKVRGKQARQVFQSRALVQIIEQVSQRNIGGQRHTEELSLTLDGKALWFKASVGNVVDRTESLGIVTVLRDITAEKAAQARSAEFVSAVSHEIKTPLASVKAYAEMLADGDAEGDPDTQAKFLNIIEVQTDRMTRLLDSMLDIARIESGVVRVDKKLVSLNELIEGGAKLMAPAANAKSLKIEQRLSSMYLPVCVDPDMLSRVVMNLISNAIKYTDNSGQITLRSLIQDDRAVLEVEDTGRGIPKDALPRLFQKFYRVKENENVAPGTGLGLSLVRHIVEEVHGGTVEVESEVGKGSTFRVRLPLEQLN
jgi:two-component system phosphate regulon sensor histidine kinase PhoR